MDQGPLPTNKAPIYRREIVLRQPPIGPQATATPSVPIASHHAALQEERNTSPTVLVINSSHEMAKEITMQLTLHIPGCLITYAPTLALAQWIIARRRIDLVVSSAILPDGDGERLRPLLERRTPRPDLVILRDNNWTKLINNKFCQAPAQQAQQPSLVKEVSAGLRNDLNNPLQAIVAMVFVAKASGELSPTTTQALDAINSAAKNMSKIVWGLEDTLRTVIQRG